jgi:hypothetical protein
MTDLITLFGLSDIRCDQCGRVVKPLYLLGGPFGLPVQLLCDDCCDADTGDEAA